jgi:transposase
MNTGMPQKGVYGEKSGRRFRRLNILGAISGGNPFARHLFQENTTTKKFNEWVEECLIPELRPGQVVIMDNASFHKSKETVALIESVGASVLFLPPYSPDFNPIEQFWGTLKARIRRVAVYFDTLEEAVCECFNRTTQDIMGVLGSQTV